MSFIRNLKLAQKLSLLVIPPILVFLFVAVEQIIYFHKHYQDDKQLIRLATLSTVQSTLLHDLQKERGYSAAFIGAKGQKFGSELSNQRTQTDQKLTQYTNYLNKQKGTITEAAILKQLAAISTQLQALEATRSRISSLEISTAEAVGYYSTLNNLLISVNEDVARVGGSVDMVHAIQAYDALIQAKEMAGIERALLSNTFAQDRFDTGVYEKTIVLAAKQEVLLSHFYSEATTDIQALYQSFTESPVVAKVIAYRTIAQNHGTSGGFNTPAKDWFDAATARIDQLKGLEDAQAKNLLATTQKHLDESWSSLVSRVVMTLVVILSTLLVVVLLIGDTTRQMQKLLTTIKAVQKDHKLNVRTTIPGSDEFATIARYLDGMLDDFSKDVDNIGKSSIQLASVAEETSSTVASSNRLLEDQQQQTNMLATAVNEMNASAQEVASNTQLAADSATDASGKAQQGKSVVTTAVGSIEKLAAEIQQIGEIIGRLHQNSNNIYGVLDVIKSVAEQTNLLALNAAIEAARAGEQGRGFAVVADEVRSLAQRTQKSTQEIETMLSGFQRDSSQAAKMVNENQKTVEVTVTNARSISELLDGILISINTIRDMNLQNASATEEQVSVTNEISSNVHQIADMSMHSVSASEQITVAAREQAELALKLQDMAKRYILA